VGGSELDYVSIVEFAAITGRGCGSSAWVLGNLAVHHWMLAMWPPEAQHEIWDESADTLIGSAFAFPAGRATKVAGGYRLKGRWPFSSGIDPCTWLMVGAMVEVPGGAPEPRMFIVPLKDYTIIDTWFVAGLRGTGSKDVEIADVFVPEHRTLAVSATKGGPTPGAVLNPSPLYQLPLMALFAYVLSGTVLGIAQGAIHGFREATRKRAATYSGARLGELTAIQMRVAEAAASVDAAELIMKHNCSEAQRIAVAGSVPSIEQKVRYRRDGAFSARLCTRAVDLVFEACGGGGLYDTHPIQRAFRDAHAGAAHIALVFDVAATTYGKVALGLPCDNPML
jgi:3-hydroxy-9,10-secoandrosta-1,3,5(10)-triene-9,17-dione monooxygenase